MLEHHPTNPVNQVTWTDCDAAMRRLGLALPHEEQWEYAARAGTTTVRWTGNEDASIRGRANLEVEGVDDGHKTIAPVGSYPGNPFGLHDMLGNVQEWCANHSYEYLTEPGSDPETLHMHMIRGGGSRLPLAGARSAFRRSERTLFTETYLGLRPARPLERAEPR